MTTRKYNSGSELKTASPDLEASYITWTNNREKVNAIAQYSQAIKSTRSIERKSLAYQSDFSDLSPGISGRVGLSPDDYYAFRGSEQIPCKFPDIIVQADLIYQRVGLIRNVIDLMGDFTAQGINLVHPNPRIQTFYKNWFKKIDGCERSERFANNFYRTGNVVVRRQTAKLNKAGRNNLQRAYGEADMIIRNQKIPRYEIPMKYTFINPIFCELVGGELAAFVSRDQRQYAIKYPKKLTSLIKSPTDSEDKKIVSELPSDIRKAVKENNHVLLDKDKTSVWHYKKDDWQIWANPMIYSIMNNIQALEKLHLADMAALDGAISNIRIFKIGNFEYKIAPTATASAKLSQILESHTGGGTIDIIWGPDIELIESKTSVHQFLGEEKYKPHLNAIYGGLGIPPTLTGTFGASGTTNNFISLKTLVKRLQYGRQTLMDFWSDEIEIVRQAMGFRLPARIEFDEHILGDEATEKALMIQLLDRNVVSDEAVQKYFGKDPEMETLRVKRENKERVSNKRVPKSGPFYDAEFAQSLTKIALDKGILSPSQIGFSEEANPPYQLQPKTDEGMLEMSSRLRQEEAKVSAVPDNKKQDGVNGRPPGAKDKTKRKTKVFKPKIRAVVEIWAEKAQGKIADLVNPLVLQIFNKKNMRSLTAKETEASEVIKREIFWSLDPMSDITIDGIQKSLTELKTSYLNETYNLLKTEAMASFDRNLTFDELKHIQRFVYIENGCGDNDEI